MLLVLDYKNRYLQKKHRFDSIDIDKFVNYLTSDYNSKIRATNFNQLLNENLSDDVIVYTGSQMELYKDYIEDIMYFYKDKKMVPDYEVLKSHENKFFQEIYNRQNKINTNIRSWLIGTLSDFDEIVKKNDFPEKFVVKGKNGSASTNVTICSSIEEGRKAILKYNQEVVNAFNNQTPAKYDLYPGENSEHRQMIIQEFIKLPKFDYRVQIMGDRYFVHKRTIETEDGLTSGEGSTNDYECKVSDNLLNYAKNIFDKIKSPFAILDIIEMENGDCYLIEWSGIHLGLVSLLNAKRYFELEQNWNEHQLKEIHVEWEYAQAITGYINKIKK